MTFYMMDGFIYNSTVLLN
uniref:Uncharacterized protein n=1 Tax=Arundo donax TaxID=35708 RepID=A0A0A9A0Y1_ARUDO